ncbi:MAG: hypothetical protein KDB74_01490 [Flavobacteriales bacterium]|nr:hypothetical protein [Flavobacteriales bacterium]
MKKRIDIIIAKPLKKKMKKPPILEEDVMEDEMEDEMNMLPMIDKDMEEEKPEIDEDLEIGLEAAAEEMMSALEGKDIKSFVEALKSFLDQR